MGRGPPLPIVGPLLRPLIGLGAEAIAHHQRKKSNASANGPSPGPEPVPPVIAPEPAASGSQSLAPPPPYAEHDPDAEKPDDDDPDVETDEEQWELDEVAQGVLNDRANHADPGFTSSVPKGNFAAPASVEQLVGSFVKHHPPTGSGRALEYPVILPQRRPRNQNRGFVRAFAPLLGECGINQDAWFGFLDTFVESLKVSPLFDVVNLAASVAGFVPEPTAQIVSFAVSTADVIAKRTYGRYRNNTFLAQINEAYFKPQGLCCLIMTYKPDASGSPIATFDMHDTVVRVVKGPEGNWQKIRSKMAGTQGTSCGRAQVPQAAPLVYPTLDTASEGEKRSAWQRSTAFVADYFDRRAHAKNYAMDPNGAFSHKPEFASSIADPSADSETPMGRHRIERRQRKASRKAERRQRKLIKVGPFTPIRMVARALKPDMLYMMVARIPAEEDLAAAREQLEIQD